jgi:ATP-binding cassette, subfamily B, bacterial
MLAAGLLVAISLLVHLQGLGSWLLQPYAGEQLVLDFRAQLFHHVQRLSLSYHDAKGTTRGYGVCWVNSCPGCASVWRT